MNRMFRLGVGWLFVASLAAQTPVLRKGVSVQMPVTTNAVAVPDADRADSLVVAVTFSGAVYLEAATTTAAQLSGKLKADLEGRPGRRVYLKADARTPYSTVAEVLDALRTARIDAPILLTSQRDLSDGAYVLPKGLEVLLPPPPDAARSIQLKAANGPASDTEMKQHAQRYRQVVLQVDAQAPFGDVVHAVDLCRAERATVFLAAPGK